MRRLLTVILAGLLLVAAAPTQAVAWGGQGHRLIAELAYARLTPAARAEIDRLLAAGPAHPVEGCALVTFGDAATWPDCVRSKVPFTATAEEHYDNIPLFGRAPKRSYCPNARCATEAIKRARRVLADRRRPAGERLEALAFLTHYIGDIHQPLHAAGNNDRGGNDVKVIYLGVATYTFNGRENQNTLHGVWDTPLLSAALRGDGSGKAEIVALADAQGRQWRGFAPDRWAAASHAIAVDVAYGALPVRPAPNVSPSAPVEISQTYVDAATPIVREQVAKAAVRTADVLNRALH